MDKVDRACEMQVIDWLQWGEFPEEPGKKGTHELALEMIAKRKADCQFYENMVTRMSEQIRVYRNLLDKPKLVQAEAILKNTGHL